MEILGHSNDRQIFYIKYDLSDTWFNDLPNKEWLLFAITDKKEINIFSEIARKSIEKNVVYFCSTGEACESFHDTFDEEIVIRDVENKYLPPYLIITTWEKDLKEELWFAIKSAYNEDQLINTIVCLDLTDSKNDDWLRNLISKINSGWIP